MNNETSNTLLVVKASHTMTFPSCNNKHNALIIDNIIICLFALTTGSGQVWIWIMDYHIEGKVPHLRGADDASLVLTPVHAQNFVAVTLEGSPGLHDELAQALHLLRHLVYWKHTSGQ